MSKLVCLAKPFAYYGVFCDRKSAKVLKSVEWERISKHYNVNVEMLRGDSVDDLNNSG
jgi:hypothetical protein